MFYWWDIYQRIISKTIWYDELFTLYVAKLGSMDHIWSALKAGIDNHPPLFYFITKTMLLVFSDPVLAIRIPQAIAIFITYTALYFILRPRFGTIHAINAVLLMRLLGAQLFAVEARPYGLMLAGVTLAWLCFTKLDESGSSKRRNLLFCGFGLSLALANASHYYAALALIPIGCAELVRSRRYGWRWPLWGAMIASLFPYLVLAELYKALFTYKMGFSVKPSILVFLMAWRETSTFTLRLLPLFLGVKMGMSFVPKPKPAREYDYPFEPYEMVGIILFCALPLVVLLVGYISTGAFALRYAFPAVLGWSIYFSMSLWRETEYSKTATLACFAFLVATSLAPRLAKMQEVPERPWDQVIASLEKTEGDVVVEFAFSYLELYYAAPDKLKHRLLFLERGFDQQNIEMMDTGDLGLNRLSSFYPMRVAGTARYVAQKQSFHLLRSDLDQNQNNRDVSSTLANQGRPLILEDTMQNYKLWRVAGAT